MVISGSAVASRPGAGRTASTRAGAASAALRSRAAHLGPERRRPQVLDAALQIVVAEGVRAVSVGRIAEHLEVSRPVVYACYRDRNAILRALLEREERRLTADLLEAFPQGRSAVTEADFVRGCQDLLAAVAGNIDSWRCIFDPDPDPAVAERFARGRVVFASAVGERLAPTLREWQVEGVDEKLPVLVEFFQCSCEAAVRSLLVEGTSWTAERLGEFLGRAVFRAIRHA